MRTILYIDEHTTALGSMYGLLHAHGYRCITATSVDEAERTFVLNQIDLVILHHPSPLESAEISTNLKRLRRIGVLLIAREETPETVPSAIDAILTHPLDPEVLLKTIAGILARDAS